MNIFAYIKYNSYLCSMGKINKVFGNYKIELRKFKRVMGHDDSIPYQGELWANNIHIANCWNDGWGGETNVEPLNIELFNDVAEVVCKTFGAFGIKTWQYTIPILADELASMCEMNKHITAKQKNGLVFKRDDNSLIVVPFKTNKRNVIPIAELLLTNQGQTLIKNTIKKYQAQGFTLMNNNITYTKVLN